MRGFLIAVLFAFSLTVTPAAADKKIEVDAKSSDAEVAGIFFRRNGTARRWWRPFRGRGRLFARGC